jgi:predicted kinase
LCVKRNEERERTVPKEAMDRMKRFLEPPTFAEGWDEIRVVKNWNEKENSDGRDR